MADQQHPIAGAAFLVVMFGLIGTAAYRGQEAVWTRQAEEAERGAQAAADAERERLRGRMSDAMYAAESGEVDKAIAMFEALVQEHPERPALRFNLGLAYRGADRIEDAEKVFDALLARNAQDWDALAEKATLAKQRGDLEAALALLVRIPERKGGVATRIKGDVTWADALEDPRLVKILERHVEDATGDTAIRRLAEVERQRKAFEHEQAGE